MSHLEAEKLEGTEESEAVSAIASLTVGGVADPHSRWVGQVTDDVGLQWVWLVYQNVSYKACSLVSCNSNTF